VKRLRRTQRWFLDEVRAKSALPRAARRAAAADTVVLPSRTLSPAQRVAIYGDMYAARLHECLEVNFPVTLALVGHRRFDALGRRYVTRHPPSSWTLNRFAAQFPAFLASLDDLPRRVLVCDVAAIERAMSAAFDAPDAAPLTPADVARVPADAWPDARLVPSPSLTVLALSTHANVAVKSVLEDERKPKRLPRGPAWLAVYRKDLRVWRLDLTPPMHAALSSLARGRTLSQALRAASRADEGDTATLPARVRRWFALWVEEGVFAGVRHAGSGATKPSLP
jgi:hypothetical protein